MLDNPSPVTSGEGSFVLHIHSIFLTSRAESLGHAPKTVVIPQIYRIKRAADFVQVAFALRVAVAEYSFTPAPCAASAN